MLYSFHHCGALVGEPKIAEGNCRRAIGSLGSSELSMREKPTRTSLTSRSVTTHVSPTDRSVFFDGLLTPVDSVARPPVRHALVELFPVELRAAHEEPVLLVDLPVHAPGGHVTRDVLR